jgi:hypothetical protein
LVFSEDPDFDQNPVSARQPATITANSITFTDSEKPAEITAESG